MSFFPIIPTKYIIHMQEKKGAPLLLWHGHTRNFGRKNIHQKKKKKETEGVAIIIEKDRSVHTHTKLSIYGHIICAHTELWEMLLIPFFISRFLAKGVKKGEQTADYCDIKERKAICSFIELFSLWLSMELENLDRFCFL